MSKSPDAFRTISEVSEWLDTPTYVLRFWESRFPQIKPVKRAGGRRYYRPDDMLLLGGIKQLLHFDDKSIKHVKGLLKTHGVKHVMSVSFDLDTQVVSPPSKADADDTAEIDQIVKSKPKAQKKALAVEVRVVKKGKIAQDTAQNVDDDETDSETAEQAAPKEAAVSIADETHEAMAKVRATEAARVEAVKQAAAEKQAEDSDAKEWADLVPDGIKFVPYRIRPAMDYDAGAMGEIETLYYSLRMARNSMKRARKQQEQRAR